MMQEEFIDADILSRIIHVVMQPTWIDGCANETQHKM